MSNAKRYFPKQGITRHEQSVSESVLAIKVTERNLISTKDWVGKFNDDQVEALFRVDKTGDVSEHRIRVKTPKGWRVARVGEYVVRHFNYGINGHTLPENAPPHFFSVGKDEFLENYELA